MEKQTGINAFGSQNRSIDLSNGGNERAAGLATVDMGDTDSNPIDVLGERPERQGTNPVAASAGIYAAPGGEEGDEDDDDEDDDTDLDLDDDLEDDTDATAASDDVDVDIEKDLTEEDLNDDDLLLADDDEDEDEDDETLL